jgi:hypothetical protein
MPEAYGFRVRRRVRTCGYLCGLSDGRFRRGTGEHRSGRAPHAEAINNRTSA